MLIYRLFPKQLLCSLFFLIGWTPAFAKITTTAVQLGNEKVVIKQWQNRNGKVFVHLHQNEKTALKAARTVVKTQGGRVMSLIHRGGRNIVFYLHRKRYEFDPNRMFSDRGIRQTLSEFGAYSVEAHKVVKKLATQVKARLPVRGKVIAVHNNESYSLREYYHGKALAKEAKAFYMNQQQHYRNFYFVTQKQDYERLKALRFNSVWQAESIQDDGSLSVYLASRPYVNVEAGHQHLATQVKMLKNA